ncbi:hypothetical protein AB5I41_24845 [Sphingomonas sp. MMS24-JH45]
MDILPGPDCTDMAEVRAGVDQVDRELVALLRRRFDYGRRRAHQARAPGRDPTSQRPGRRRARRRRDRADAIAAIWRRRWSRRRSPMSWEATDRQQRVGCGGGGGCVLAIRPARPCSHPYHQASTHSLPLPQGREKRGNPALAGARA